MVEFTGHDGKVVKQMAIKPILFNTEMVRAILDGRKSCTRRLVKHDVESVLNSPYHKAHPELEDKQIISKLCNPPYQLGDIIYIRETWAWCPCWDCGLDVEETGSGKSWKIKRQVARQMLAKIFVMFAKILTVIRTMMGLLPLTV